MEKLGSFSIGHWTIVLLIVIVVFGTKRISTLGSDMGGALKGFKDALSSPGQNKPDNE